VRDTEVARPGAGPSGEELGISRWVGDAKEVQATEVGRIHSGVCKPEQKRGPEFRAPNSGYSVGYHPKLIPIGRVLSLCGSAFARTEEKRDVYIKAAGEHRRVGA